MFRNALLLGLFGLFLPVGQDPLDRIHWERSWKDALTAAEATNRPIMVHFNVDTEAVCLNIAREHFRNKKVIKRSREFVCVVGSLGEHAKDKVFSDEGLCHRFGSLTCAEHRQTEVKSRSTIMQTRTITAPQFVFVTPDLEMLVRRPFDLPVSELLELMERALYYHNPSLTPADVLAKRKELISTLLADAASDNAASRKRAIAVLAKRDEPEIVRFFLAQTSPDVDEVKRNEAVKALGEAQNPNCLETLVGLLGDRSVQLRRNAVIALNGLGMAEAVEPLIKAYGIESATRSRALIVRSCVTCAPHDSAVQKLLRKAMKAQKPLIRTHAARSFLDMQRPRPDAYSKLLGMARADSDTGVRAVACHAATSVALRELLAAEMAGSDGNAAAPLDPDRKKILALVNKKLKSALKTVAARDRERTLRDYAAVCLEALDGKGTDIESGLDPFFEEGALFSIED